MNYLCASSDEAFEHLKTASVFLTGPPGAGKSHLINRIIEWFNIHNINVGVTGATGIASKLINGCTIHSWSGIGLALESKEEIYQKIKQRYNIKRNWQKTQVLIIDEISMISGEIWLLLDYLGQRMRANTKPFGGIQLIAVGDFYQLPPVKGTILIEPQFNFTGYFKYLIHLSQNFRSNDQTLNQILSMVRSGLKLSPELNQVLKSKVLKRDEQIVNWPILVGLRDTAREFNNEQLNKINEKEYVFKVDIKCIDTSTSTPILITRANKSVYEPYMNITFNECTFEEQLVLKRGAPVIYLKNDPDNELVNGSVGTIVDFTDGNIPIVKFKYGEVPIQKHSHTKSFTIGQVVVQVNVEQYPLLLAYALTIHRSQGQTLSQCSILLDDTIWEEGQAYVALSRLQSIDNLTLIKYNKSAFKISHKVKEFYAKFEQNSSKPNPVQNHIP
jgi:ATP-dependent DNA helicase PIF1